MADALISPTVGGAMWAATAGMAAYSAKKVQQELDEKKIPLMGVLGAFIFAAQMINFTIPGTGSSGHLAGGLILAILLGPYAGFLTLASVLTIQALFFADGGLLALGCNIFNMGFFACFIAYPLIYKPLITNNPTSRGTLLATSLAAITALQLGAFSVVMETLVSGISELPFKTFVILMQPIHLAIGIVEGLITTAVVSFVRQARPEILQNASLAKPLGNISIKRVMIGLALVAVFTAGALSWFASVHPDGLEWAMFHITGKTELPVRDQLHQSLARIQAGTALFPGYQFKQTPASPEKTRTIPKPGWGSPNAGTSFAGLIGGGLTLLLAGLIGFGVRWCKRSKQ